MAPSAHLVAALGAWFGLLASGERQAVRGAVTLATDVSDGALGVPPSAAMEVEAQDGDPECPVVKTALIKLGIPESELSQRSRLWAGVLWRDAWTDDTDAGPCDVRELMFEGRPLYGQLSPELGSLTTLRKLSLPRTRVSGDVALLANLSKVTALRLQDTRVHGDIGHLSQLLDLYALDLCDTFVEGSLSAVADVYDLRVLKLARTGVTGDLVMLESFAAAFLEDLDLSGSQVRGDLGHVHVLKMLKKLELAGTQVSGDISSLLNVSKLTVANLANSKVTGSPDRRWSFKLPQLTYLSLKETETRFLIDDIYIHPPVRFLQKIEELDVSGSPLNGELGRLLDMFRDCHHLARIRASACNLTGKIYRTGSIHLTKSLLLLDLGWNNISALEDLPSESILQVTLSGNPYLKVSTEALREAIFGEVQVDLRGCDVRQSADVRQGLAERYLTRTHEAVEFNKARRYYCHGVTAETIRITPELFMPEELCGCLPGSVGSATDCAPCASGTYNDLSNQTQCKQCPRHSQTKGAGASSVGECLCDFGRIETDHSSCVCQSGDALNLDEGDCVKCEDLNLDCDAPGHSVVSAPPKPGFARLSANATRAFRCLQPAAQRCNSGTSSAHELGCAPGYTGPLCGTCSDGYRSKRKLCKKCKAATQIRISHPRIAVGVLLMVVMVAAAAVVAVKRRSRSSPGTPDETTGLSEVLLPLLRAQMSVLLQFVQLWGVLAALSESESFWEQEYAQYLQLTAGGLQDALSLECIFGERARVVTALTGPLVPLVLLLVCVLLEAVARSTGVRVALKVLQFLFIGGASSCAHLMSCQYEDGGYQSLGDDAFRLLLPHLKCQDDGWQAKLADGIGVMAALSYYMVIPGLLLFLLQRQKLALAPSRQSVATAEVRQGSAVLRIKAFQVSDAGQSDVLDKEHMITKRLLAAAIAHCVVYFQGAVRLQLQEDKMLVQGSKDTPPLETAGRSSVFALNDQGYLDHCKWMKLTRMLTERCVFDEAEKSDRVLAGAKRLFCKYAIFEHVWFEVALKLVSVFLVALVSSDDGLEFCVGLALVMSITLAANQPYVQRQANDLHSCCLACLAVAAIAFAQPNVWLARGTLVLPFVVAFCHTLRPDGPEALALRLYEAAEHRLADLEHGEQLQLCVAMRSLL